MSETLTQMRADLAAEKATSALLRGELVEQQEKNATQAAHIAQLEAQIEQMQSLIDGAASPEQ
jgi:cell division protein FtsB